MNLPRPFNKRIYEMIDAFVKTKLIFQSSHSKDFMHPNDTMYIVSPHELKYITSGQRSPMHEDLNTKSMHMMFNVVGNFMSHIIPSLATPIISVSHNAITHHHLLISLVTAQVGKKATNKETTFHIPCMPRVKSTKFHQLESNISVSHATT